MRDYGMSEEELTVVGHTFLPINNTSEIERGISCVDRTSAFFVDACLWRQTLVVPGT